MGATTAGRDPAQPPPPGGGGQPGGSGSGGQNPQGGTQPPGPPQTRAVAGQPAAYHIFATGSRLGWASGLGQYSIGPADTSIIEHLQVAGEHVMWANRESYLPVKAWPNWTANRAEMRSWADGLVRDPRNPTRRQISISANSRAGTLADALRYQTMGAPEHVATCDAAYMSLGYELGYSQQTLGIADEAARNGDRVLAREARQDGMSHLQNSNRILSEYERTLHLTGRCADLRDVKTRLDAIVGMDIGDLSGQSRSTTAAWTLALERIVALRGGQPAQAVPAPPPPSPPARTGGGTQPAAAPAQVPGADPGELEGYRVTGSKIYRFEKQGDEYVGSLEHVPSSAGQFGIRQGDQVFRLMRVSPNLYKGRYQKRVETEVVDGWQVGKKVDRQVPVWVSVLGVVAFSWGPGASIAYLAPAGFISPSRVQAETLGAPDYSDGWGLVRVQNPGNWTFPSGRRVRLVSEDPPASSGHAIFSRELRGVASLSGISRWGRARLGSQYSSCTRTTTERSQRGSR